jgi:hypothetical protein
VKVHDIITERAALDMDFFVYSYTTQMLMLIMAGQIIKEDSFYMRNEANFILSMSLRGVPRSRSAGTTERRGNLRVLIKDAYEKERKIGNEAILSAHKS